MAHDSSTCVAMRAVADPSRYAQQLGVILPQQLANISNHAFSGFGFSVHSGCSAPCSSSSCCTVLEIRICGVVPPLYGYVNGVWSHLQQSCPTEGRGKPEQHRLRQTTTARRFIASDPPCVLCVSGPVRAAARVAMLRPAFGGSRNEQTGNGAGNGGRRSGTWHLQALAVREI